MSEPAGPRHLGPMAGQTYQLGPMTLAFKPGEAEVNGAYSMIESMEPPGASVDLHRHPSWQETFVVLEGSFEFEVAGARHALGSERSSSFREELRTASRARRARPAAC